VSQDDIDGDIGGGGEVQGGQGTLLVGILCITILRFI